MPQKKQQQARDAFRRTSNAMFEKPQKRTTETSWWIGANRDEFRLRAGLAMPLHVSIAEERNGKHQSDEPKPDPDAAGATAESTDTKHAAVNTEHAPAQPAALGDSRDRQGSR